jgi:hypothetical protein
MLSCYGTSSRIKIQHTGLKIFCLANSAKIRLRL